MLGAACLILSSIVPSGIFYKEWPVITLAILGKVSVSLLLQIFICICRLRLEWASPLTRVMCGRASFSPQQSGILLSQHAPPLPGLLNNHSNSHLVSIDWAPSWLH